jgi:hypothetical protein
MSTNCHLLTLVTAVVLACGTMPPGIFRSYNKGKGTGFITLESQLRCIA